MWFQFDWCDGPLVGGERKTWLFCAWLAWSRFRVVLATSDKTMPTLISCIDQSCGDFGGVPTYALCENVPRNIFRFCGRLCYVADDDDVHQ